MQKIGLVLLVQRRKSNPRVAYHGVLPLKLFGVTDPWRTDENERPSHLSYRQ